MYNLYIVGCFVSLGFYLGTIDSDFLEKNLGAWLLGLIVCPLLSWASVIADIIHEIRKETK